MSNLSKVGENMKVAISGYIGSGKSLVSNYLRKKGYDVWDCDKQSHSILNNKAKEEIIASFGRDIVVDGEINRVLLAQRIFSDEQQKVTLEQIIHPLLLKKMLQASEEVSLFIAEVPLLYQVKWDSYFDVVLWVESDEMIRCQRLMEYRKYTVEEARLRIAAVKRVDNKHAIMLYNNGSMDELYCQIDKVIEMW